MSDQGLCPTCELPNSVHDNLGLMKCLARQLLKMGARIQELEAENVALRDNLQREKAFVNDQIRGDNSIIDLKNNVIAELHEEIKRLSAPTPEPREARE